MMLSSLLSPWPQPTRQSLRVARDGTCGQAWGQGQGIVFPVCFLSVQFSRLISYYLEVAGEGGYETRAGITSTHHLEFPPFNLQEHSSSTPRVCSLF